MTRWKTQLPFPVQVVNRVEVLDLLSGGKLATEYNYHNGYWDGAEREFRGFAQVDSLDTETFERFNEKLKVKSEKWGDVLVNNLMNSTEYYTPPVLTKSWFYPGPIGSDYSRWEEVDFSDQYWQGDLTILKRTQQTKTLLASLPRRARRDALRTFRGTLLRSEVYALDKSPLQSKPYTVTESLMGLRLEFEPSQNPDLFKGWKQSGQGYWAGSGYVFFPFSEGQRTTQYERGNDPMHSFSLSDGFDAYGNPLNSLSVGLPRGANPLGGGNGKYLGAYSKTEYIYKDIPGGQYMVNRVKKSTSFDASRAAYNTGIFAYQNAIINSNPLPGTVIGCSLNFYDGEAFIGLPYGQIGKYGVGVRSETLLITDQIITDAYKTDTPECFKATPDWSDINGYPATFEGLLQNGDQRLGYKDRRGDFPNHVEGWYGEGGLMKYDFQDNLIEHPVGLTLETKDVFDNRSTTEFDEYGLLPVNTKQWLNITDFLETKAEYDYRTFQTNKVTDANDNITVFDFSPLGLLQATAVIGKGTEGDYKADTGSFYERYAPSVQMEYDFFAFKNDANPIWVKTIQREQHYQHNPDSPTIVKLDYSDSFGRLLQTREQAQDVIFGNETFGSSGLFGDQNSSGSPALGKERDENTPLNVVVSGWKIYNNKGDVVEQYEPFFDKGFEYVLPQLSTTGGTIKPQLGVKFKLFYDPLGRVVKTVNPNSSQQRTIYGIPNALNTPDSFTPTPWESYAYDANDLAPLTHPNSNVPQSTWYTPKSSLLDALGRTLQTAEHKAHYNIDTSQYENVVMQYSYDIRGNLLEVRDPYNRKVFEYIYDLRPPQKNENERNQPLPPLWTKHIDSGISNVFFDTVSRISEITDAKEALILNTYDSGSRPVRIWAKDKNGEDVILRQMMEYGDDSSLFDPKNKNLKGQLYKHYDEAGLIEIPEYDFKRNVLTNKRQCISDTELMSVFNGPPANWELECYRVNWTDMPNILDTKVFETNSEYDALNRVTKVTYPEDADNNRKIGIPTYNRAGVLEKVAFDGTDYVKHIAYNTKGQRLLITFGNDIMIRYLYDNLTFRLKRLKSEKFTQTGWTFTPQSGTVKQDYSYTNDLIGNIVEINDKSPDCGVGGTSSLDREFEYDPLYRLIEVDGRENNPSTPFPWWDDSYRSTNNSTTTAYTQHYRYDKLGNIIKLQHIGDTLFTRNFDYSNTNNRLNSITIGMNTYSYLYDNAGNQIQENSNRHFEWDFTNNMRCFYNQAGTAEPTIYGQYLYDSAGNRVKKIVRTQGGNYESTTYIHGAFEYKTNGTDEQTTTHIMDDTSRIAMIRKGDDFGDTTPAIKYNLEDHLGSSCLLLETNGALINKEEYYPFGETSFGSYAKKRYRFSSKERDSESGLYYYGARYYLPMSCRFTSCDPKSAEYSRQSSYIGFNNNPLFFIDPSGMEGIPVQEQLHIQSLDLNVSNVNVEPLNGGWGGYKDPYNKIGQYAHLAFALYMSAISGTSGNWQTEVNLRPPIGAEIGDGNLRPDLIYTGSNDNRGSVYELKPVSHKVDPGRTKALNQTQGYADRLNQINFQEKSNWIIGNSNGTPLPFNQATLTLKLEGYTFNYWIEDANSGLILYKTIDGPKEKQPSPSLVPVRTPVVQPVPTPVIVPMVPTGVILQRILQRIIFIPIFIIPEMNQQNPYRNTQMHS